jgi:F0F1-type ATP synthase delta subunit
MEASYVKAATELLRAGKKPDAVLRGLKLTLTARGYERLYVRVLHGVLLALQKDAKSDIPVVTLAKKEDESALKAAIKETLSELGAPASYDVLIDPNMIGGHKVSFNNTTIDKSYKEALVSLYRSVTT